MRNGKLRLGIASILLLAGLNSCAGRPAANYPPAELPVAGALPPAAPALQLQLPVDTELFPAPLVQRSPSELAYPFLGTDFSADSGAGNHQVPPTDAYALDVQAGQSAWAMYSFALAAAEVPTRLRLHVSDEAQVGNALPPGLPYWIALANYATGRWEWHGPFATYETNIYLAPGSGGQYVSALQHAHCVVLGFTATGSAPATIALEDGLLATDGTGGNTAPEAFLVVAPGTGQPGDTLNVDASLSSDPDGTIADYQWDLDGDDLFDEPGQEQAARGTATFNYTLLSPGQWNITVRVIDNDGAAGQFAVEVTCRGWQVQDFFNGGNSPPFAYGIREINGRPAIAYGYGSQLKYAIASTALGTDPGDWQHLRIDDGSGNHPDQTAALAEINGHPAIAWGQIASPHNLMYSYASSATGNKPADWQTITVDDYPGWIAQTCDLELVNGFPAISYDDLTNTMLRYAVSDDPLGESGWSIVFVDNHESSGNQSSIGTFQGLPHVLHRRMDESGWHDRSVLMRSSSGSGSQQSDWTELLNLEGAGEVYIPGNLSRIGSSIGFPLAHAASGANLYGLEYRYLDPETTILHGALIGDFYLDGHTPVLAETGSGPGILFMDSLGNLQYAQGSSVDGSGSWQLEDIETIQTNFFVYVFMDMAEINGHICAVYTDSFNNRIRYAVRFD